MPSLAVNWWAVLVAAALSWLVGGAWYSKGLFGSRWMALMGKTERQIRTEGLLSPPQAMAVAFLMALVTASVLAAVIHWSGVTQWWEGAFVGVVLGVGFVVTSQVVISAFEARPWGLMFIMTGHQVVEFVLMGIVLAVWQ